MRPDLSLLCKKFLTHSPASKRQVRHTCSAPLCLVCAFMKGSQEVGHLLQTHDKHSAAV